MTTKEMFLKEIPKFEPFHIVKCDENLRETVVQRMEHCLGMDRRKTYIRHNRRFYKPYRNYYTTQSPDDLWEALVELGYANKCRGDLFQNGNGCMYEVSDLGRSWLGCLTGVFIHEEEK